MRIFVENNRRPEILDRVSDLGFQVFDSDKDYDLNIIGERNPNGTTDQFDDYINIVFKIDGFWNWYIYPCTTDPGKWYLENFGSRSGTAILCHPQQMRGVYKIDKHAGKYDALCQRNGEVKVWRDSNRDDVHDMIGVPDEGWFGINIHKSSRDSVVVGKWSAGCSVFKREADFNEFMSFCRKQIAHTGWDSFTYTLIMGK